MKEANVIFTFDGRDLQIQCTLEEKMRAICQKFSDKFSKEIDSLLFLYGGYQINFGFKLKEQANLEDLKDNKMIILVYKKEKFICPKCKQRNQLNKDILESIDGIQSQIDYIIGMNKNSSINSQLKNINKMLNMINQNIKNNEETINNLSSDSNNINNNDKNKINTDKNNINEISKTKLIENIKVNDVFKKIFTYLDEKTKLKLIKYNNNLKSKIDYTLLHYKFYSGKYIIYEKDWIGKEFSGKDDKLLYEGEYLNGERNGRGKEYYSDGILKFEGEYANGKRNGKGKEYNNSNGKLEFEGEYLNGKRNGKGKEYYNDNGKLMFEGQYLNGKRNGKGKEYYDNGELRFEGEYLYDERNGKGKEYDWGGNLIFEGEYLNGIKIIN